MLCYRRGMARAFNRLPLGKRHEVYAAQLRKQATPAENLFRAHLAALGLPYRFQHGFFKPRYRIVDFYLPQQNLVVEIDGRYHDTETDRMRDEEFERLSGIAVLRLTNEQVLTGHVPDLQRASRDRTSQGK
jgi:very-short-patch-repair endonuclease